MTLIKAIKDAKVAFSEAMKPAEREFQLIVAGRVVAQRLGDCELVKAINDLGDCKFEVVELVNANKHALKAVSRQSAKEGHQFKEAFARFRSV